MNRFVSLEFGLDCKTFSQNVRSLSRGFKNFDAMLSFRCLWDHCEPLKFMDVHNKTHPPPWTTARDAAHRVIAGH